jgi:hypothetical protein
MKRKQTPKQLANIEPHKFKPGNPGGGRPKGSVSIVKVIERMLDQEISVKDPLSGNKEKKKVIEAVATALLVKGINGDVSAIKELLDRVDGKVVQKTENVNVNHEDALRMLSDDIEAIPNDDES